MSELIRKGTGGAFNGDDTAVSLFSVGTAGWSTPVAVPTLPPPIEKARRGGGTGTPRREFVPEKEAVRVRRIEPEEDLDEDLAAVFAALYMTRSFPAA